MANALVKVGHEFQPLVPPRGSVAGQRAGGRARLPGRRPRSTTSRRQSSASSASPIESDVLICSDDPDAATHGVPRSSRGSPAAGPSMRASCRTQRAIEAFTAVLLQLNVRYKTRVAPRLTGIKL